MVRASACATPDLVSSSRLRDLHFRRPLGRDQERGEIRLGKISIIVRLLLAAHRPRHALFVVEKARLLQHLAAALDLLHLSLDLVFDRLAHEAEGVDVLQLDARAELLRAARPDADVGVAAEGALFQVAVVDAQVDQRQPQRLEVLARLFGRAQLRLADDLDERDARAVQIHLAAALGVDVLAGVLLEVDAGQADRAEARHGDGAAGADRQFVLRDLIALRQVWIEIVLPRPDRPLGDPAAESLAGLDGHLHRGAVEAGQRAGQAQADGADLRVGRRAEARRAAAEDLRARQELRVDLQADDRLEVSDRHVPPAAATARRSPRAAHRRARGGARSPRRRACR